MSIDPRFLPSADAALQWDADGDASPSTDAIPSGDDQSPSKPRADSAKTEQNDTGTVPADQRAADQRSADQRSIEELVEMHSDGVWRYLRTLGCDDSTADDLTQDTFIRVMRRESFVQHSDAATASYLRRTAYNLMVSRHRRNKKVQLVPEAGMVDEVWDRWMGKDASGVPAIDALQDCFSQLTERAQHALRMRFTSEASRVEIAESLGISDHGARNLMQRAKTSLRECVEAKLKPLS